MRRALILATAAIGACATLGSHDCVAHGKARQCLLPPAALASLDGAAFAVTVARGANETLWLVQIAANPEVVTLVASDPLGLPRFTLRQDMAGLAVVPSGALPVAEAARLIALLQFAHAPNPPLAAALHGATLEEHSGPGDQSARELRLDGVVVLRATWRDGRLRLDQPDAALVVTVEPLVGSER